MFQRNLFVKVDLVSFVKPKMKDLDRSISLKHNINELLPQGQRPTDESNVWSWAFVSRLEATNMNHLGNPYLKSIGYPFINPNQPKLGSHVVCA